MGPRAGSLVTTNVELVRQLGKGGMGSVWVARQHDADTEVAVKFISAELRRQGPAACGASSARPAPRPRSSSTHVVQIFDHGVTDDGMPYIVMELLDGETLADAARTRGVARAYATSA